MLRQLSIKNFAIIDDIRIEFSEGLTVLTGETGAGKTIIIQAVNLLLGARASAELVRTGTDAAQIEAFFEISEPEHIQTIKEIGYDAYEGLVIKRIISKNNRHKIYINGSLSTITLLNKITENLASISGQHAHQLLLDKERHLTILDKYGDLVSQREKVKNIYLKTLPLIEKLRKLEEQEKVQGERIDFLEFQKNEIKSAQIETGEDEKIETDLIRLKNGEQLYMVIHQAIEFVYNADGSAFEKISQAVKQLEGVLKFDQNLSLSLQKLEEASIKVEDVTKELQENLNNIQIDEKQIDQMEERLDVLTKLKRKYKGSLEDILNRLDTIEKELSDIENISDEIAETKSKIAEIQKELIEAALQLSAKRRKAADVLSEKTEKELASLRMEKTRFKAVLYEHKGGRDSQNKMSIDGKIVTETGIDSAEFKIAPNVGEDMKPLASIASGGELSRVVLALKSILSNSESVGTVIFDEVDAGIGGGTAESVGKKLFSLSSCHQTICITHLPQIAGFADSHFKISKHVSEGRTKTVIVPVHGEERTKEIARMLSGDNFTKAALDHAREMIRKS